MKYVFTEKVKLAKAEYDLADLIETIEQEGLTKDVYDLYAAPEELTVTPTTNYINADVLHLLATYHIRGTVIKFPSYTLTNKRPRPEWRYRFVSELPKVYIKTNNTTSEKAYAYGQRLITACNKQNRTTMNYTNVENAYKVIARQCLAHNIYVSSRNEKTVMEARAELECAKFIKENLAIAPDIKCALSDDELHFYAKAFDIEMPKWYLKAYNIKTKHGYAIVPYVTQSSNIILPNTDPNKPGYAGNDIEDNAPVTLKRDAAPVELNLYEAERARLAEQVMFYLNLPIEERLCFLNERFDYCEVCGCYEVREGCTCGIHAAPEEHEYQQFMACREYALSEVLYK